MSDSQYGDSWKITLPCTRTEAEAIDQSIVTLDFLDMQPTIVTRELDPQKREEWELDAYFEGKPTTETCIAIRDLIPSAVAQSLEAIPEKLPNEDWVTISQSGLEPIQTDRFYIYGSHEQPAKNDQLINIQMDAGQAFGTGHHETTEGCLKMVESIAANGKRFVNIADIGTGTGLLAFAAMHFWPRASFIASDVDPIAVDVTRKNAASNNVKLGTGRSSLVLCTASGTDHKLIKARAPYDLLIANILAGPLIELAPGFAASLKTGGTLILAGLMTPQIEPLKKAYQRHGLRLVQVQVNGDWPTLRLIKRRQHPLQRKASGRGNTSQAPGDYGEW